MLDQQLYSCQTQIYRCNTLRYRLSFVLINLQLNIKAERDVGIRDGRKAEARSNCGNGRAERQAGRVKEQRVLAAGRQQVISHLTGNTRLGGQTTTR